jgi:N-acetylmuramoyl-L-alanine amidase
MTIKRQSRRALGAAATAGALIGTIGSFWGGNGEREAAAAATRRSAAPAALPIGRGDAVEFAARACLAYSPLAPANGRTVFLDAGHGGLDTGATSFAAGRTATEKELTLAIARRSLASLRQRGYRVVISRTADSTVARRQPADFAGGLLTPAAIKRDIVARNVCANAARADVAVSVHLNSFDDPSVGGTETIYSANRSFSSRNRTLAVLLQGAVHASLERAGLTAPDRGIRTDDGAGGAALTPQAAAYGQLLQLGPAAPPWFTSPTRMPAAVVEALFITNRAEARFAEGAAGQRAIAFGVGVGIDAYFTPAGQKLS